MGIMMTDGVMGSRHNNKIKIKECRKSSDNYRKSSEELPQYVQLRGPRKMVGRTSDEKEKEKAREKGESPYNHPPSKDRFASKQVMGRKGRVEKTAARI